MNIKSRSFSFFLKGMNYYVFLPSHCSWNETSISYKLRKQHYNERRNRDAP